MLAVNSDTASASPYTLDGNMIYINDSKARIVVIPHTVEESQYIYLNVTPKTFTGNVNVIFGFDSESALPKSIDRYNGNWINIANIFNKIYYNYDNKDVWYYASNIPVTAGTEYYIRFWLDVLPNATGKYDFAIYPSSYGTNINQAITDGNFYMIDPWFNSSYSKKIVDVVNYSKTVVSNFTYLMNSSSFDLGDPSANQIVWTIADKLNTTQYLYYINNTRYQVVNSTENGYQPFDVEQGNMTSFNRTGLWNRDGKTLAIWHLSDNTDSSENGLTLTENSGATASNAWIGKGYSLDTTKSLSSTSANLYSWKNESGNMTIMFWINITTASSGTNIISMADTGCGNDLFDISQQASTTLLFQLRDNICGAQTLTSTSSLTTNKWYFVVWRVNRTNITLNLFDTTTSLENKSTNFSLVTTYNTIDEFRIGHDADFISGFTGVIDEIRMFNKSLQFSEIEAIWRTTSKQSVSFFNRTDFPAGITIDSPANTTYYNFVPLNFTVTIDAGTIDKCWYKIDGGTNTTITSCSNVSSLSSTAGTHSLGVFANLTNGTYITPSYKNFTYDFNLNITSLGEDTLIPLGNVTVYINNETSFYTTEFNYSINISKNSVPQGNVTIIVSRGTSLRTYRTEITGVGQTQYVYLPESTSYDFTFFTYTGSNPVNNTYLNFEKLINGSYTSISSVYTAVDGTSVVNLEPPLDVRVTASKTGYNTNIFMFTPTSAKASLITNIKMTPIGGSSEFIGIETTGDSGNLTITYQPNTTSLLNSSTVVNVTIYDALGLITSASINVTKTNYTNTTQHYYSGASGVPTGITFTTTLNSKGSYYFNTCVVRNGSSYCSTRTYIYYNYTWGNGTGGIFQDTGEDTLSRTFWALFGLILLTIGCGVILKFIGFGGSLVVGVIGVIALGIVGILNIYEVILFIIISSAVLWKVGL